MGKLYTLLKTLPALQYRAVKRTVGFQCIYPKLQN